VVLVSGRRPLHAALTAAALVGALIPAKAASGSEQARPTWAASPHGAMLERIVPPSLSARELPDASSEGARLTARLCVQCHHLVNPAMHTPVRWKSVVDRMVWRMRGNGNMGALMKEMMTHFSAPTDAEVEALTHYLQKFGQAEIDPRHPALKTRAGEVFSIACSQCHALPDPARHTAREWPAVVERMKRHMSWANLIVGAPELRTTPELKTDEIVALLRRYAKPENIR
jgi:cytochrome c2